MEANRARVLGIDPGQTTGLAVVEFSQARQSATAVWSEQMDWDNAADEIERRVGSVQVIAGERFMVNVQTARRGQEYVEAAMFMLGVCRREARRADIELVLEASSAAKKLVTDDVLKHLRLFPPGLTHAQDAARQAVLYAVKRRLVDPRSLLPESPRGAR